MNRFHGFHPTQLQDRVISIDLDRRHAASNQ
jgi:hypothetical protein